MNEEQPFRYQAVDNPRDLLRKQLHFEKEEENDLMFCVDETPQERKHHRYHYTHFEEE